MKVIFLDIDGVLNCKNMYVNKLSTHYNIEDNRYTSFYEPSRLLLNKLIEETDAKIVISSTWRYDGLRYMKHVWEHENMSGEIIGITPTLSASWHPVPRGCEIDYWLNEKGFFQCFWSKEQQQRAIDESGIENYIIIDDDSDMLYNQRHHFVQVLPSPRNDDGFGLEHYNDALKILSTSLVELYY
jgi:hypothetical protein